MNIYKGTVFALAACLIWGLIFVVPGFMGQFDSFEIAIGRYCFFGLATLPFLFRKRLRYPRAIWFKGLYFSLISSFGYYIFVILSLRYATPAVCALILGISPITIAFYGNMKQRECSTKSLLLPSFLILVGLLMINLPHLTAHDSLGSYLLGILAAVGSLLSWTWYVVANARFLKQNPDVSTHDWSIILGLLTFAWALVIGGFYCAFFTENLAKFAAVNNDLLYFLGGCAVLGILCSWAGTYLWNKASFYLPVSLAGQLMIFETIFGLVFIYLLSQSLPPFLEIGGIALFLIAIIYSFQTRVPTTH